MSVTSSANSPCLPRIAVAAVLTLLPLVYFFPAVLGKVTLVPGDGWTQIFGIRILVGEMIARGELPLWNPYIFAGMPLLAAIQPGALYPPTWLFAVLPPQVAMNVLVLTTYHLTLIGTYLYARRIGMTRIGAIISGITFTFGGYMIAHLGHTNRINAAAWLPWILLAVESCWASCQLASRPANGFSDDATQTDSLRDPGTWRWVVLGALFIALQILAGEPQMTLYTGMVAGAYALFALPFRAKPQRTARFVMALAGMLIGGGLLSMVQLLPARELLQLGDRAGLDYEYFSQFSLPPRQTLGLFFPYFFGGAVMPPYRVPYWGKWNVTETCGYVGMAAWLLALVAVFNWSGSASGSDRVLAGNEPGNSPSRYHPWFRTDAAWLTRFWACCAGAALLLSFGGYLPFGLYRILHHVPVYNLFRASGRHLVTFNFAVAVLAGLGATALAEKDQVRIRQALFKASSFLAVLVGLGVIAYCFLARWLVMDAPLPPQQSWPGTMSNPELYVPLMFFALSVGGAIVFARRWKVGTGVVLAMILFLDLMSFGFFYEWRAVNFNVAERLADPPTVKFIKQRESDLNSFRIVSRSDKPYARNADLLDYPNISIVRGLQSVNGYDPVRLGQMAEVAGRVTLDGVIAEPGALSIAAQGFNLLNAKYLLNERGRPSTDAPVIYEGISFDARRMDLTMPRWAQARLDGNAAATELAVISAMERATGIADGSPVLNIKLHTANGQVIERQLLAGRDTSEWTPDSAAAIPSWNAIGFRGRGFLAHLKFDRAEIEYIEFESVVDHGELIVTRASLFDAAEKASYSLDALNLSSDRWRKLAEFGEVDVYENLKAMPRAWFVSRAILAPSPEVLRTIKTGRLTNGAPFDPAESVLLESELFANRPLKMLLSAAVAPLVPKSEVPKNEVKITRYQPQRIELQVSNASAGFLCLSEIYYRGWEARVEGQRASIDRVNFTLRGIELPSGNHNVEFVFRAHSFRNGAAWSAVGLLLLCIGGVISYRKRK